MNIKNQLVHTTILFVLLLCSSGKLSAEGTKQLSPTSSDTVMLHTNAPGFGNFASFSSFNTTSSLNITVCDANCDTIYIGLSPEHNDAGFLDGAGRYVFRILDPTGAVVAGPFIIDTSNNNVSTWSDAVNGPDVLGMGGYSTDLSEFPYAVFVPTMTGDYTIQFDDTPTTSIVNIPWFDFTVSCNGVVQDGRLWSRNWALRTPPQDPNVSPECGFDRDFNGTFYSYTMDGFVSRIDFDSSGFQGLSFTVAFGDSGPGNTGNVMEDRRSVNNADATSGAADHQIFLNDPDTCAYPTDTSQCGEAFLLSVSCEAPDSFCINVAVTEMGQVEVILDFDTNGIYTIDSFDVILAMIFDSAGQACLPWDGLRGDGSPIPFGEDVPTIVRYSQGVQHYAAYDVEFLKYGFCVETVRPICTSAATDILYWDDSEITDDVNTVTIDEGDPGTGQPRVQLNGCECQEDSCRTWDNFQIGDPPSSNCSGPPYGYGDNATLNTWWYARVVVVDGIFLPFVQVFITGDSAICDGDTTSFFANVQPDSINFIFEWTGPGGFTASTQSTGPIGLEGTYYVTITDTVSQCSAIDSMVLIVFDNPTTTVTFTCVGPNQQNANVDLTVSGGLPPYTYLWSNGETTQDLTNVPPGTYTVVVTDANGCMAFDTVTVSGCCELIITCGPTDAGTFACIDDVPPSTSTGIVLVEFCDDTTTVTVETDNGGTGCPGDTLLIIRVHTVTDAAGGFATCTQIFTVVDNIAPALVDAVNDTSIICGASISPDVTGLPTFVDNCSDVLLTFTDDSIGFDGTCTNDVIGVVIRTFSATDECGNTNSSFTQAISIIDTIAPTFTVPADITIDCADDISPINTGIITDTTDNCLGPVTLSFTDLVLAGVCPTTDSILRNWVAIDICGNSFNQIQTIVLIDTVGPTFTVPPTITIDCLGDTDPEVTGTIDDASDACSDFTISFTDLIVPNGCPVNDTVFRTWVVEDACGNSTTGEQIILRLDTVPPTFDLPADTILDCGMSIDTSVTGSVTNVADNCAETTVSFFDVFVLGECPGIDTTFRTWVVQDECANSSTGIQTIIRIDTLPPTITLCPADVTVTCTDDTSPQSLGEATATDACDGAVEISSEDSVLPEGCTNNTPLIRTWTATDDCGNTSTCIQTILIQDLEPPTFITPADITIACDVDSSPQSTGTPTDLADNCSIPTIDFSDAISDNGCLPFADQIFRTWTATDECGNTSTDVQIISRIDTVPPTFTVPAETSISCDQDSLPTTTGFPTDTLDNCSSITIDFSDIILPNGCPTQDSIERTWIVSDDCGNSSTAIQYILRLDLEAPTFTVPADTIVDCEDDTSPANTGDVTDAVDNCAAVTVTFADVTVDAACPALYVINRTWTAEDECLNSTTAVQVITVQDTTAPTFIPPAETTINCEDDINDLTLTGNVTEVSDCGTIQDTTYADVVVIDGCDGTAVIVRTFTVSDECNNASTGTQMITVQDTLSPMIMIPPDITIQCDQDPQDTSITGGMIVFFDNCSMMFFASFTDDLSGLTGCNGTGTILRLWLVDDECDNSSTMTQVITIEDTTPPEAICNDFMIDFGMSTSIDITPEDIDNGSNDNCGDVTLELSQTTFTCEEFIGVSSLPVTLTVTDECGNTSTCEANVTGIGGLLEIECPDDITVNLGPGECTAIVNYVVTADAICGGSAVITQIDNSGLTSGDAFPIGVTVQTYQATNATDTAICSFTITVVEFDVPVVLACNDTVNVSVDQNCEAHLFVDMILEGDQYGCYDDFIITVEDFGSDTGWIVLSGIPLNQCYTITITDPETGNSCWGVACFEDKLPPQIICACPPGNDADSCIISCLEVDQLLDGNIPPNLYPEVTDNCGIASIVITDIVLDDQGCGEGGILVTWVVTDSNGLSSSCVQEFGIEPLSIDSLDFPPNYTGECGTSSDPDLTGWPQVNGIDLTDEAGLCNLFLGYWDKVLLDCGGGTKILRTWTILDWCTLELVEFPQVIKLSDLEGPDLDCPSDLTVGTDFWYCYANVSVPRPVASDDCSDVVDFDLFMSAGILTQFGNNFVVNELPIGTHTAIWTVTDLCGNSSTCSFTITVEDDVVPVANCDHHTIVSLTNDGPYGVTLVPASVFDDGSYDNCGPVTFLARRMESCIDFDWTTEGACIDHIPGGIPPVNSRDRGTVLRPCVPFACCDVGNGPIMVELQVIDAAGNVNFCMVEVEVQDKLSPFVECPPDITISCDYWFNVEEGLFSDGEGNHNGNLDEDPLSPIFGNMFDAFRYSENARQDIIINDPGNEEVSQPHFWGIDGWADDNCEVNLSVRVRVFNDCTGDDLPGDAPAGAVRLIERRFSASDGNEGIAPGTCTQRIWVVDFDPFYITDLTCNNSNPNDGVIWPCDVVLTTCPEDLNGTGEPIVFDDACSLIGVAYEDTRFDFVDGACFKILRRWSVIDWCQYDPITGEGLWHYTQVIKVNDHEGPELLDCPVGPVVLCVADPGVSLPDNNQAFLGEDNPLSSSCSAHLNLCQTVHETCTEFVKFDVKIYPFNGHEFIQVKSSTTVAVDTTTNNAVLCFDTRESSIQSVRLNGIPYNSPFCGNYHRILWSIQDDCGNWTTCEYLFRLEDCKQPSPVCINGLSTVIMPVGCEVTLWAKDFDASSFDDCTPADELLFSFSGDSYQPSQLFNVDNIPAFGVETTIHIWVADGGTDDNCNGTISWDERNKDFCTTTVVFTDNTGDCTSSSSLVQGHIMTEYDDPVKHVIVTLTKDNNPISSMTTIETGKYLLAVPPIIGQRYDIEPKRNDQHRNGVSTLDLVRIQKHLLGKQYFESPYQYIAADATNNQQVSAIDLIEIRKLILGIYTEFPSNQSWRFVDRNSAISDPTNPWPFQEIISFQYDGTSLSGLDFIGVKIGDVNNTVIANATKILPREGRRVIYVKSESAQYVQAGEEVSVMLTIPESVAGFQWTLEASGLEYKGVSSDDIRISDDNIGRLDNGIITMSWNNAELNPSALKEIKLELQFIARQSGKVADMLSMSGKVTAAEAYTNTDEILDVKLDTRNDQSAADFALYQNEPNPWTATTFIRFDLPESSHVKLTFFDVSGKVIKVIEGEYAAGENSIQVNKKEMSTQGVIYYRLDSGNYSATKKMIRIE